jgi:NAD(P)-dependent dehydrogenase (short-subunit alcohol dehydrogenase family)
VHRFGDVADGRDRNADARSMNGPARDKFTNKIPMRHTGRPEDIAEAATFLASEAAGYITGVVLDVDGGIFHRILDLVLLRSSSRPAQAVQQ